MIPREQVKAYGSSSETFFPFTVIAFTVVTKQIKKKIICPTSRITNYFTIDIQIPTVKIQLSPRAKLTIVTLENVVSSFQPTNKNY